MTLPKLLFACMTKGVVISAGKRGRIRFNPRDQVSGAMREAIKVHGDAIRELLRDGDVDSWRMIRLDRPEADQPPEDGADYLDDDYVEPSPELIEKWAMEEMEREYGELGTEPRKTRFGFPTSDMDDDDEQARTPF